MLPSPPAGNDAIPREMRMAGGEGSRLIALFVFFLLALPVRAQDPPLAGRPTNFSHLVGKFSIAVDAKPVDVVVEEPIQVRVTITGDVAKGTPPPSRKFLKIFPEDLSESFFVEALPDLDTADPMQKTWTFVWNLRPKSETVREIPGLALVYYLNKYQTARSEPISLRVNPLPNPDPPLANVSEIFLTLDDAPAANATPYLWLWLAPVLAILSWWLAGSRSFHESIDRSLAKTLAEMRSRPEAAADVFADFLARRLGTSLAGRTVADIDRLLKRRGASAELRRDVADWLHGDDARRFAPNAQLSSPDLPRAERLLTRLSDELPRGVAIGLVLVLAVAPSAIAEPVAVGRIHFREKNYDGAAAAFAASVKNEPDRAGHYVNLGNALMLAGDAPAAIAVFREGLRVDPDHAGLRARLVEARRSVALPQGSPLTPQSESWVETWPWATIRWLFLAAVLATTATLPAAIRRRHRGAMLAGIACLIVAASSGGLIAARWSMLSASDAKKTIVVKTETAFRLGNGVDFAAHAESSTLPRGYEVREIGRRGGWIHVECPGGQVGWVAASDVVPPFASE